MPKGLVVEMKFIVVLLSASLLSGCFFGDDEEKVEKKEYLKGYSIRSDRDVYIPKQVIKKVEETYLKGYRSENPTSTLTDAQVTAQVPRQYFSFEVLLEPKRVGTALDGDYRFVFPKGGGVIDLKDYILAGKGSFKVKVNVIDEAFIESGTSDIEVHFVSQMKQRKLDRRVFGGGCNKAYTISKFFKSKMMGEGVEVNATRQRYMGVLGGTFFMSLYHKGSLYMTSLSFEDSRYPQYSCDYRGE